MEYVYPGHPEWYMLDHGYFLLDLDFDGKVGTLTFKKMTIEMTGYYNENMTTDEEEPYIVWEFKVNETNTGLIIFPGSESERLMKEIEPIKGLQWREYLDENDRVTIDMPTAEHLSLMPNLADPELANKAE